MNNKTFVEAARFLGERIMTEKPDPKNRITHAFDSSLSHPPQENSEPCRMTSIST